MKDKIDKLALDANFLDENDPSTLIAFLESIQSIQLLVKGKNEVVESLFSALYDFIKAVSEKIFPFEMLETKLPEFVNFLFLNDDELCSKKKKFSFSANQEDQIRTISAIFNVKAEIPSEPSLPGFEIGFDDDIPEDDESSSMDFSEDVQLFIDFIVEARDHLAIVEESILGLEASRNDSSKIDAIFRSFHTIKGVALFLKLKRIGQLSHKTESALDKIRSSGMGISTQTADTLFKVRDQVIEMIDALERNVEKNILKEESFEIDHLLAEVDDLIAGEKEHSNALVVKDEGVVKSTQTGSRESGGVDNSIKVDYLKIDNLINYTGELLIAQSLLWNNEYVTTNSDQRFVNIIEQIKRISTELQKISLSMRMVPIKQTFSKMQRIARDVSHKVKKQVRVVIEGEDTELDRSLIESISDPLLHMVRNSIDHGIELPEVRKEKGKSETGVVCLRAFHEGDCIVIQVLDDGRGLDTEKIMDKAIQQGLIKDNSVPLTVAQIYQLIMEPGFSTAAVVTDVSGRGVGMDVVRSNVERLRGTIDISSKVDEGTSMMVRIPLTLAIIVGMIVTIGGEYYIIPLVSIRDILRPETNQIHTVEYKNEVLHIRGEIIPVVKLNQIFNIENGKTKLEDALLIVVEYDGKTKALMVDDILGQQEVVIKSIHETMNTEKYFSGCSILGNGRASLILNIGRFF